MTPVKEDVSISRHKNKGILLGFFSSGLELPSSDAFKESFLSKSS